MNAPLKIRAHHLLCMQGFQGYGYDNEFTIHMGKIVSRLRAEPDTLVEVTSDCDAICEGCPNKDGNTCRQDAEANCRVKITDGNVLTRAGIKPGSVDRIRAMFDRVNNTFKAKKQLEGICDDCRWTKQCLWYAGVEHSEEYRP